MSAEEPAPNEIFFQLLKTAFDPVLLQCGEAIRSLADYDIPEAYAGPFQRFHRFVTDPQPSYIAIWRADEKLESRWYRRHVDGVLSDVRAGLAAAHYHRENLAKLEDAVTGILAESDFAARMGDATLALGATRKMDFEYQAFVLSCRRALDYLAGAVGSYFKTESYSFRTLPKSLGRQLPHGVASALCAAHARHVEGLSFIMAEGRRSVRNRIAHNESVAAGVINLTSKGFVLAGGGEEMGMRRKGPSRLQDVLAARLEQLHSCVADLIDSFIEAAERVENR